MHIHHLNCGCHCPVGGALFDDKSRGLLARIDTQVLLLETDQGLVLVDSGYGMQDVVGRPRRLAYLWPAILNTRLSESRTALRQVKSLGYRAQDVRHIILTHLDFDHAGGIEDFPAARVHVLADELNAAEHKRFGLVARQRYRPRDWDDVSEWRLYSAGGERWNGFDAVRQLDGLPSEILLVPLRGHTLGHAGVAIDTGNGWLLHAGDAYLHHTQLKGRAMPVGLAVYDRIMTSDLAAARYNRERLRHLHQEDTGVRITCSHDVAILGGAD